MRDTIIKATQSCLKNSVLPTIQEKEEMLKASIAAERFEDAAKLRDEIKSLKSQVKPDACSTFRQDAELLNADLRASLSAERFEEAAATRDKIRCAFNPASSYSARTQHASYQPSMRQRERLNHRSRTDPRAPSRRGFTPSQRQQRATALPRTQADNQLY